jgi:hypothetical protein
VHQHEAADALLLAGGGVEDVRTALERAGVDAEEGQLTDERVGGNLEGQAAKRLVVEGLRSISSPLLGSVPQTEPTSSGLGRKSTMASRSFSTMTPRPSPPVTAKNWPEGRTCGYSLSSSVVSSWPSRYFSMRCVVGLNGGLDEVVAVALGLFFHVLGDFALDELVVGVVLVGVGLHLDEVDHAVDALLEADRQVDGVGALGEALVDRFEGLVEVTAGLVDLVDEANARHAVLVGLAPDGFGLRLHAHLAVEDGDGAVEHAQTARPRR